MRIWILIAVLLVAGPASSVDLVCSVPAENVARAQELCAELRVSLRVRVSEWSNDACATEFLRIGLLEGERKSTRRAFRASVNTAVSAAVLTFGSTWDQIPAAMCGDGTLDAEFGESCDDGNTENGDGCDSSCAIE